MRGDNTLSVKDDSKVEAELIKRQEEARIRIDFKKQYPTISQEDLNKVVPLQLQLQDAKNSPINTQEKEAVLDKEINLITKKYADQIKSPAAILDEEQSTAGETVAKRDDQSTELAGEITQAEKETTDQPGQTPEIETEVSETEEVRYTLPEDPKEARKDFEIIDNRDGKAGLEIEEDGLGNWVVRNKKTDKLTYTKTKKQAQQELKDLDWDYGEGDIIEVEKTVTETKSAPDVIKGVIKTDGDIIIQRFTKQRGGRTQQNALAPVSVLDEFDIDLYVAKSKDDKYTFEVEVEVMPREFSGDGGTINNDDELASLPFNVGQTVVIKYQNAGGAVELERTITQLQRNGGFCRVIVDPAIDFTAGSANSENNPLIFIKAPTEKPNLTLSRS